MVKVIHNIVHWTCVYTIFVGYMKSNRRAFSLVWFGKLFKCFYPPKLHINAHRFLAQHVVVACRLWGLCSVQCAVCTVYRLQRLRHQTQNLITARKIDNMFLWQQSKIKRDNSFPFLFSHITSHTCTMYIVHYACCMYLCWCL